MGNVNMKALLVRAKDALYNSFEPDNQCKLWYDIEAAMAASGTEADWCSECRAPQYVTPNGTHHCGELSGTEAAPVLTAEELKSCIFTFADGGLNFAVTLDKVNNLMRQKALRQPAQAAASPEGEGREASDEITGLIAELADFQAGCISRSYEYGLYERVLQVLAALRQSAAPSGGAAAAQHVDWMQVLLNLMNGQESGRDGQPCFHVDHEGIEERFCLRAKFWAGHDDMHKFVSLADLLAQESKTGAVTETK